MSPAIMPDGRKYPLYVNQNMNSHISNKPIRLAYEKDKPDQIMAEGSRLEKAFDELNSSSYFPKKFPNIVTKFEGWPTMGNLSCSYLDFFNEINRVLVL